MYGNPVHVPEAASVFVQKASKQFTDRIAAIILVGSFARGDQRVHSDIDLLVLVDRVDRRLLHRIGEIVTEMPTKHEINPALVATFELERHPDIFDWLSIKHDGIVLFGRMPTIITNRLTELDRAKQIAHDVLMSSRHYIAVAEPAQKFANGKLWHWNQKPLAFAIRFYEFHLTGRYTHSLHDLAAKYPVLVLDPVSEYEQILDECIDICERILATESS